MSYKIEITQSAHKELKNLHTIYREKIVATIDALSANPRPPGCKKLEGDKRTYRIRVGVYRILYQIRDDVLVIIVIRIGHRKDVYRR